MTKQTIPAFLYAQENSYGAPDEPPYKFYVWPSNMASAGYIPLGRTELEFDVPSHDEIIAQHVVLLRTKIVEVRAEAERQVNDLFNQLSKLEALTYTPPASDK